MRAITCTFWLFGGISLLAASSETNAEKFTAMRSSFSGVNGAIRCFQCPTDNYTIASITGAASANALGCLFALLMQSSCRVVIDHVWLEHLRGLCIIRYEHLMARADRRQSLPSSFILVNRTLVPWLHAPISSSEVSSDVALFALAYITNFNVV